VKNVSSLRKNSLMVGNIVELNSSIVLEAGGQNILLPFSSTKVSLPSVGIFGWTSN
jgi:hypothetical protein